MGQRVEENAMPEGVASVSPVADRIEMIDRISVIFYEARLLEFAVSGAPIDYVAREALLSLVMGHADKLCDLLVEIEGKEVVQ